MNDEIVEESKKKSISGKFDLFFQENTKKELPNKEEPKDVSIQRS